MAIKNHLQSVYQAWQGFQAGSGKLLQTRPVVSLTKVALVLGAISLAIWQSTDYWPDKQDPTLVEKKAELAGATDRQEVLGTVSEVFPSETPVINQESELEASPSASPQASQSSRQFSLTSQITSLLKSIIQFPETIKEIFVSDPEKIVLFRLNYAAGERVKFGLLTRFNKNDLFNKIRVYNYQGKKIEVLKEIVEQANGQKLVFLSLPRSFRPGKYTFEFEDADGQKQTQDFTWGVLAINTNQSIYLPGETAQLAMAVLDERGMMVCDALVWLTITDPHGKQTTLSTENGSIIVNPECQLHDFTLKPDYESAYLVGGVGGYELELSAETANGTQTIFDAFEVRESVPFEVERTTATRIYPPKLYPVTLKIKAHQDFQGVVEERVPASFEIVSTIPVSEVSEDSTLEVKKVSWDVDWKQGETYRLAYEFKAPNVSPQFYLLGPLTFYQRESVSDQRKSVFKELRSWQIAADAPDNYTERYESWSATGAGAWEDKNLNTAYSVPVNAVVEIAVGNLKKNATRTGGVRANGSGLDRYFELQEAESGGLAYVVMHAQTDGSGIIEQYASVTADITFYLLGYWDSGTYVEKKDTYGAASADTWEDEDLSGSGVGANNIVEMVMTNSDTTNEYEAGVRANGSSLVRKIALRKAEATGGVATMTMLAKADSSSIIDIYEDDTTAIGMYLVGYWSSAPGTYTEKFETISAPSSDKTWTNKDLSGSPFSVPANAVTEIILASGANAVENQMGVRTNGSGLARILEPQEAEDGGRDTARIHTTVDSSSILEIYHEDVSDTPYEFQLVGYWELAATTITVSGNVYDFGTANALTECDVDGGTDELSLRDSSTTYTASCSNADGSFSFTSVTQPSAGDGMVIWIDDAQAPETDGAMVVRYDGSGDSTSNIFYDDAVTVTSDDTTGVDILDMDTYDSVDDADIPYTATDAAPDTLSVNSGYELLVKIKTGVAAGSTVFDPNGTVTTDATGGDFHIDDGSAAYLDTATNTIGRDIEIDGGATLNIDADTNVNGGDITMSGTSPAVTTTAGTPTVTMSSTGSIGGGTTPSITFYNLSTSGTGTTTLSNAVTVNNDVSVGTGTTLRTNANLNIDGGDLTTTTTGIVDYTSGTPTVDIDGSGILGGGSGNITFYNLDLGDGTSDTTTLSSTITGIDNSLTINASQIFTVGSNNVTVGSSSVTNSGTISVAGTYNQTGGTTTIRSSSGGAATIGGAGTLTFYNLSFLPDVASAPTFTLGSAGGQTLNIDGNLIVGNGTNGVTVNWNTNDPTLQVGGNLTLDSLSTWTKSDSATLTFDGTTTPVTWTDNNSTKQDLGTVSINGPKEVDLGSSVKATSVDITTGDTLDLQSSGYTLTLTGSGTPLTKTGTLTVGTNSTVAYTSGSGTTALSSAETTYHDLTINGTGTFTSGVVLNVNDQLTVTSGTLAMGANNLNVGSSSVTNSGTISVTGGLTQSGGTTVVSTSDTSTAPTLGGSGSTSFASLNIGPTSADNLTYTFTTAGNITVSSVLTIQDAGASDTHTLDAADDTITLSGTGTPLVIDSNAAFTASTSTVSYTGNGATNVKDTTYYSLSVGTNNSSNITYTLAGSVVVNNQVNLQSAASGYLNTFALSTYDLTVGSSGVANSGGIAVPIRSSLSQSASGTTTVSSSNSGSATIGGAGSMSVYNLAIGSASDNLTYTFTSAGNISTAGVLTITAGGTGTHTLDGADDTITLSGTGTPLVNNDTFTPSTSTISYTGNGATNVTSATYYTLSIGTNNSTNISYTAQGAITANNQVSLQSAAAGYTNTFALSTYDLSVGSSGVSDSGTISVPVRSSFTQSASGTTTVSTSDTSTAPTLGGAGSTTFYTLNIGPTSADNLTYTFKTSGDLSISADLVVQDAGVSDNHTLDVNTNDNVITITGSLTIDANATFSASSNTSNALTIGDDFTNNGTFTHNSGKIIFNNSANTSKLLYGGATTFGDFTVSTAGKQIQFDETDQTNIVGTLTLQGTNCSAGRIFLDSSTNDDQWALNATGSYDIDYVDIEDSNAVSALIANYSTEEDNNNTGWTIYGETCAPVEVQIKGGIQLRGGSQLKQ